MLLDDIRHEDEGAPERYFVRQALANIYNRAIARSERALRDAETRQAYAELEAQRVGFEQGWEGCKQAAIRIVCDLGNSTAVSEVVRVGQMIVDRMATLARPSQSPEEGQ
jgi:hypothetical protein